MPIRITQQQLETIFDHAVAEAPDECCGILVGRTHPSGAEVREVHAVENVWEGTRTTRFELDPRAHLRIQRQAREAGLDIVGYYHSHPHGPADASTFDTELAWQGFAYVIVSLKDGQPDEVKSWRLDETTERLVAEEVDIIQPT